MTQITLTNDQDEHSYVGVESGRCVLCNKFNEKVIVCDNSEGDNNSVVLCLKCCVKYLRD